MLTTLKNRVRASSLHRLWRSVRTAQQRSSFGALLREFHQAQGIYDDARVREQLSTLAPRRRLPSPEETLHIACISGVDWEQYGLFQALGQNRRFALLDKQQAKAGLSPEPSLRREQFGQRVLSWLHDVEKDNGPVHMVFLGLGGSELAPDVLRELQARGIWSVMIFLDDKQFMPGPREQGLVDGWQLAIAREVDLYWTTWRSGADWMTAKGVRAWYAAEAADPDFFRPYDLPRDIDVLWVGGGYGARRHFVQALRGFGFGVEAYGPGWENGYVSSEEMIRLYSRAKVVLGLGGVGQGTEVLCLKGRDFEVPMSGAAYLTTFNSELCDHFEIGKEIMCFGSILDCVEILHWLLQRPQIAQSVRDAARKRCLREHTWTHRIDAFLGMMGLSASTN